MKCQITKQDLAGPLTVAPKDEGRYAISGVVVDRERLFATDGRILFIRPLPGAMGICESDKPTLFPREQAEAACKAMGARSTAELELNGTVRLDIHGGGKFQGCSDATPPDIDAAKPQGEPAVTVRFSIELLSKLLLAAKRSGADDVEFDVHGSARATFARFLDEDETTTPVATGIIMPKTIT